MSVLADFTARRLPAARISFPVLMLGLLGATLLASATPGHAAGTATVLNGTITDSDPTQTGRFVRDWAPSVCGVSKRAPVLADTLARHYDAYPFANRSSAPLCVTVQLQSACTGTNDVFSAAYLGSFDPAHLATNYLADLGYSPGQDTGVSSYSFTVPAGASYVVTVYEVTPNAGCGSYTLSVSNNVVGTPVASATPTWTPARTPTQTPINTSTAVPSTATWTPMPPTGTATWTPTRTPTNTPTRTSVPPTATSAPSSPTLTATRTPTNTPSRTPTRTPTRTASPTAPPATNTPVSSSPTPVGNCTIFPADNIWYRDISQMPIHAQSAAYINAIGANDFLHPGFASGTWQGETIGNPVTIVGLGQPLVPIHFTLYAQQSDPGPYPVPSSARISGGPTSDGDRHVIVWDQGRCMEYDLYRAFPNADGSWDAGSGAVWSLASNALRRDGWTSADAAGLPMLPALVRYDEVAAGVIRHALRFTASSAAIAPAHIWPARHHDPSSTGIVPYGSRLRLKAGVNISGFDPRVQVVLQALKTYGMILSDADGSDQIDIDGDPDPRWNDAVMNSMQSLHASDFEVVDVSGLMIDPNSGQSR